MKKLLLILAVIFCLGCTPKPYDGHSSRNDVWAEWEYIGGYTYCRTITIDNQDFIVVANVRGVTSITPTSRHSKPPLINIQTEPGIKGHKDYLLQ